MILIVGVLIDLSPRKAPFTHIALVDIIAKRATPEQLALI